ncbi:MAG: TRAP transporter large permease [Sneathiellales bacterium]|nr:TRAP transporter large permease [Sneathiellales bacterium]
MTGIAFAFFLFIGVPVFAVLILSTVVYILLTGETALFDNFLIQLYGGLGNMGLLAIPLFIITGELMNECGITSRLVALSRVFVGSVRSGLAFVNILANAFMAAIIGSAIAQTAVMTRVMVPEMVREGYPRADAAAMTCAGGLLGPVIPPSMPFIIYAVLSQVPVADMLIAGLVPGLLLAGAFIVMAAVIGFQKQYPKSDAVNRREALKVVLNSLPALIVPASIIGTILAGFGSPTEAVASASVAAILVGGFVYRELDFRLIPEILERAGRNSAMVLVIVAASAVFGWVIIYDQIPMKLADFMTGLTENRYLFLFLVVAALIILGMLIDGIAALIISVPILLPIAQDTYGIDAVQFGVVVVLTLVLGLLTPPVGAALYVSSSISKAPPVALFRSVFPYIAVTLVILMVLCLFPSISTALL